MIDWHAIIGKCNQSDDVCCQKLSLSLLLVCLFLFLFGEALKKMVPAREKNKWQEVLYWTTYFKIALTHDIVCRFVPGDLGRKN